MPLTIISRRTITYQEAGSGEITVLLVPAREQIQVVKDMAGINGPSMNMRDSNGNTVKNTGPKQVQLSRVHTGRRFIYGNLPKEISDMRQAVRVWLAEDFAPAHCHAFFYIFSSTVIIHGVREQDDEGFQHWRTAQLPVDESDPLKSMINAISDYAMSNPSEGLTVAVQNKLDLYEKLQKGLATYNISPMPFSKLKPASNVKPLYLHRDFTLLYLTLALFGLITLCASGAYLVLTYFNLQDLKEEAAEVQMRIDNIKLNQNVGKITDPQTVLRAMSRSVNQQPSAIINAAGHAVANLGELSIIVADFSGSSEVAGGAPLEPGQLAVRASVENLKQDLLLTQEQETASTLASMPWVREIRRSGVVGDRGDFTVILQIDQAAEAPVILPSASPISETEAVSETEVVSGTIQVSDTVSIPVSETEVVSSSTLSVSDTIELGDIQ